jgi:hypothetical protein
MRATLDEVYKQIDNAPYNEQGGIWWDESQRPHLFKSSAHPARAGHFGRLLVDSRDLGRAETQMAEYNRLKHWVKAGDPGVSR